MKVNGQLRFTVINSQASSLHSLIADGHYRFTLLGRNKWIALTDSKAYLQANCNKEGFNTRTIYRRARVGILGNNENDCNTCDSVMGFGLDSTACGDLHSFRALCYILVQWWSAFKWILKQLQNKQDEAIQELYVKMQDFKIWRVYERLENTAIKHLSSESRKSECMMLAKALYRFPYAMCVCKWKNANKQSKIETKENKKRDIFSQLF